MKNRLTVGLALLALLISSIFGAVNQAVATTLPPPYVILLPLVMQPRGGIRGDSFLVENKTANVNQPVWFDFKVTNLYVHTVSFGLVSAHTDVGVTGKSWSGSLAPHASLTWQDHMQFSSPGTYQVYLGVCYGTATACGNGTAPWDRLSDSVTVTIFTPPTGNLLPNGNFESGDSSYSTGTGLTNWTAWWVEDNCQGNNQLNYACKPNGFYMEHQPDTGGNPFVHTGDSSLTVRNNWDPWVAGAKQTISGLTSGQRVRLTAYTHLWAASKDWAFTVPSNTSIGAFSKIGLDPTGADTPLGGSVVWSNSISPHDTWQQVSTEVVVGSSGKVTVVLYTSYRGYSTNFMTASWDDAYLAVVP